MLGHDFDNDLFRKYITIFGLLFNNINLKRTNNEGTVTQTMRVPISLANKDSMVARLAVDPTLNKEAAINLPRMAFELTHIQYNPQTMLNKIGRVVKTGDDADHAKVVYNPVTYDLSFTLSILTKNYEDGLKIVGQILPFFTPNYIVTADLMPDMGLNKDISITLNNVVNQDNYSTDYLQRRTIVWTLDFTMHAEIYGPQRDVPLIKFIDTGVYCNNNYVGTIRVQPGLTEDGEPTSNAEASVNVHSIWHYDDYGYVTLDTVGPYANLSSNT